MSGRELATLLCSPEYLRNLVTSGRISPEILSRVLRCQMPVIAAVGAPTNQAVKLARQANLTLVGRVRGDRMNVYSGEERIC